MQYHKTMWFISVLLSVAFAAPLPFKFVDTNFDQVVAASKDVTTLIYIWSPHMVLSQRGLNEVAALATEKKFHLVVLMDGAADADTAHLLQQRNKWPETYLMRNESAKLFAMGSRIHYPSYIVVKNRVAGHLIPGYKPQGFVEKILKRNIH